MRRFEIVDFLKGYSIFTIMIFHYFDYLQLPSPFNTMIFFGGTGVHLFVLLSGFGLYHSYINKPLTYGTFIKKRLTKIYVPYIFVVLLSALISIVVPLYNNSVYALGGHVFLYKMFDENIIGSYGYPLWFISMIMQFYFSFHLVVFIKSKLNNKWFLFSGILLSISWATLVFLINKADERVWNSFFLQYYWEFTLGIVLAERAFKNQKIISVNINQILIFTIAIINCAFDLLPKLRRPLIRVFGFQVVYVNIFFRG
jgi:peptidoglycan/LPS O-acetylase OafA/YrhL